MRTRTRLRENISQLRATADRWLAPIFDDSPPGTLRAYRTYIASWRAYSKLAVSEPLRLRDSYPCIHDRTPTTPYDPHYFHQSLWAAERILALRPDEHVDVGSESTFVGMLSVSVPVIFVDIRPFPVELPQLHPVAGDLLGTLGFEDASVRSLSCLHVAEHIGLGRYGDRLDADGTRRACTELTRILARGGQLLFSVPVGRSRVCFNAHRIHRPSQILDYFPELELVEFSVVGDDHVLVKDADLDASARLEYGCGLFSFRSP